MKTVTKLEFMALLISIQALLEDGKVDKALDVIKKVLAEADRT